MKKIEYDGNKNIIGSRLETLRRERGLSQGQTRLQKCRQ